MENSSKIKGADLDLPPWVTTPKVFVVAETRVNDDAIEELMEHLEVDDWQIPDVPDAEILTELAGKSCYMSFDTNQNKNLTRVNGRTNAQYIQEGIIKQKHGSVLEHSTVSLFITDVSRVVTHELIRHRAGTAFSQLSGRYVRSDLKFYVPKDIQENPNALAAFGRAVHSTEEAVADLENLLEIDGADFSRKKLLTSAIRRIVGNGQANSILLTANHRALRHMIEMRTAEGAEEEIRVLFVQIAKEMKHRFSAIYADMSFIDHSTGIPVVEFEHSKV